jgi:hypothetical protein
MPKKTKKMIAKKTPMIDIIRAHMEETGGETDALLAVLKKSGYPNATKQAVCTARWRVDQSAANIDFKARASKAAAPKLGAPAKRPAKRPVYPTNGVPFAARMAAAIKKIGEGLAELTALEGETGGVVKRVERYSQMLAVVEADRQVPS